MEESGLGKFTDVFAQNEIIVETLCPLAEDDLKELGLPMPPIRSSMLPS